MRFYSQFTNCPDQATAKQLFRELAKKHHPDRGGDNATMQQLNLDYAEYLKHPKSKPQNNQQQQQQKEQQKERAKTQKRTAPPSSNTPRPRQPLTEKRREAIEMYVRIKSRHTDQTLAQTIDQTLTAEKMDKDELYQWLQSKGYKWNTSYWKRNPQS